MNQPKKKIHILVAFVSAQPIVDVQNIVIVVVIVALVVSRLARFCENAPWIVCGFVSKLWIADAICIENICCEVLERTEKVAI
jgi:hypothetical protein